MLLALIEKMVDLFFAIIPRAKPAAEQLKQTLLIAHRGVHNNKAGIFENTHQAFARASELGCWGIEFDVQCTADNILVVNHDPNLIRLWQCDAKIGELTFAELNQLAPGIPSLAEVVSKYGSSLHLFIELKTDLKRPQELAEMLTPYEPVRDYHLLTLKPEFYNNLELFPKEALLLVASHNNVSELCELSIANHYGGVLANYLLLTDKQCHALRQAQQNIGVGFINSKNSLYREINRGVYWLFTDKAYCVSHYLNNEC